MHKRKRLLAILGLALALAASTTQAERRPKPVTDVLETVVTLKVDGQVTIDIEGRVADYKIETPLGEALRAAVDRSVKTWRFRPVLIDGVARRAEAQMRITLIASETDGNFKVNVDNVIFPGTKGLAAGAVNTPRNYVTGRKLIPPRYPMGLQLSGVAGTVLLAIRVDANGSAVDVGAVQSMLLDVSGKPGALGLAIALMEQSAVTAARRWTFTLPPGFDASNPRHNTVTVPVEYTLDRPGQKGKPSAQWSTIVRTPKRVLEWMPSRSGTQSVGVADVDNGEFVPVASAMSLASDVVGRAL